MADDQTPIPPGLDDFAGAPSAPDQAAPTPIQEPIQADAAPPGLSDFIAPVAEEERLQQPSKYVEAAIQGLGKGALGPISPAILRATGVPAEEQRAIEEAHPFITGVGEAAGLLGTLGAVKGLGSVLGKVGTIVPEVAAGASRVAKIGSMAARAAVETAAYQLSDEASKVVLQDPNAATDLATVGGRAAASGLLGGIVGGGFGIGIHGGDAVWQYANGSKTAGLMKALVDKAGGYENAIPGSVQSTLDKSGIELDPVLKGALSSDPRFLEWFNTLLQTDTHASGKEVQDIYNNFRKKAGDAMIQELGKDPEAVIKSGEIDRYEEGKNLGHTLAKEQSETVGPIGAQFEKYKQRFGSEELVPDATLPTGEKIPGATSQASETIGNIANDWKNLPDSKIMNFTNRVLKYLPEQKTIKDLSQLTSELGSEVSADKLDGAFRYNAYKVLDVLRDTEEDAISNKLLKSNEPFEFQGKQGVEALNEARRQYGDQYKLSRALNDRLHMGGVNPSNFAKNLREMAQTDGESVLRRLSGKNDANLLDLLQTHYPETAQALRAYHVNEALAKGADTAKLGMNINSEALMRHIDKMSPQLKSFIASPESLQKLQEIDQLTKEFKKLPYNFSNSARTFDKLLGGLPSTALGIISGIASHSPLIGGVVGAFAKTVGRDIPDAIKLGLLKFMGSDKPVNSAGFKGALDFIHSALQGEKALNTATKNVFKEHPSDIKFIPSEKDRTGLKKMIEELNQNPDHMKKAGQKAAYYMPEHGMSIAASAVAVSNYLNSQRPQIQQTSPLDTKMKPTPQQLAQYNKALDLANHPLMVFNKVRDGSITPQDILGLKVMYPALYQRSIQKLTGEMVETLAKGNTIPYRTKMGLSLFMGQPMDSTMTPGAFSATQPPPPIPPQMAVKGSPRRSGQRPAAPALQKLPNAYETPGQSREQRKQLDR